MLLAAVSLTANNYFLSSLYSCSIYFYESKE